MSDDSDEFPWDSEDEANFVVDSLLADVPDADMLAALESVEQFHGLTDEDASAALDAALAQISLPLPQAMQRVRSPRVSREDELLSLIDGEVFPSMVLWPSRIRGLFVDTAPLTNSQRLELTIFLLANGLDPAFILEWYALRHRLRDQSAQQDVERIIARWRSGDFSDYVKVFDIYHGAWMHLNGDTCQGRQCWCKHRTR